jgi:hypothetical protein
VEAGRLMDGGQYQFEVRVTQELEVVAVVQ